MPIRRRNFFHSNIKQRAKPASSASPSVMQIGKGMGSFCFETLKRIASVILAAGLSGRDPADNQCRDASFAHVWFETCSDRAD